MDDETSNCMGMDLHAHMEARRRQELAAQVEQKADENYLKWVQTCLARATPAPHTEEITIDAPADPSAGKQVRVLVDWASPMDQWAWVPTSILQSLKDRIAELEADARIKAANANPGEPVEFRGLNGETIVARMVK